MGKKNTVSLPRMIYKRKREEQRDTQHQLKSQTLRVEQ